MSVGGLATFSINDGLSEGLVRGFRLGFIDDVEQHHLAQCETLEDVCLNLVETDYGSILQSEEKSPSAIRDAMLAKLTAEFEYLRSTAVGPLAQFLDLITYDYMIDNVILILKAVLNNPNAVVEDIISEAHPLGKLSESTLKSICAFENTPRGYSELYQTVLIDTPIGKYFKQFLAEESMKQTQDSGEVQNLLEEMPTTKLENSLRKLYLEDFHSFCVKNLGGETAVLMDILLKARADATAINITLNSFGTSLNEPSMRQSDRKMLYPSFGALYPEGTNALSFVGDEDELQAVLRNYPEYRSIFDKYVTEEKTIDDAFYEREVMLNEIAFDGQANYACFYAFVRLKEQEIRNLVWLCECIVQRQKSRMRQHYIPIFSQDSAWRVPG